MSTLVGSTTKSDLSRFVTTVVRVVPSSSGVAEVRKSLSDVWLKNCGIGPEGFLPGNQCAAGGGVAEVSTGPSVGGDFPKTTVVDTSKWPQHNAAAKWGAKKIAAMEEMLAKKDYSGLIAIDSFPKSSKPNGYQKAVHEAHKKLLDQAGSNIATQIMEKDAKPATAAQQQAVAPAAAPTKPPVSDVQAGLDKMPGGVVDGTKWKQTYSGDLGPGSASYKDANGTVWDVNWHDDPAVTKSVVTASKLYALAGTGTSPHLAAIVPVNEAGDWKLGVAKLKEKHDMVHEFLGPEPQQDFLVSDFAVHAWLGNGKLGGAGFANLGVMPTGDGNAKVVVQDAAGSLAYNIHGDPKNFSEHADEWNSMRSNAQNPQAASVFGSMTPDQLQKSAQKLAHITKGDVEKIVGEHYGEGGTFLTEILMKRKDSILKQAGLVGNAEAAQVQAKQFEPSVASVSSAIAKALPKPEVPKPVNVDVPQAVSQPKSSVPMAVPAPPVFVTAANPTANAKLQAIYKAAQTGDVAAVEAIGTNAESKNTYSKKAHQYKQQVLAAMGAGGKVDPTAQQAPVATPKPKASAPAKPVVIDTLKLPDQPSFVSSNKANVAANEKASNEMFEKAKAGDLIGLQAMAATMPPSPKLKEYHAGLVASVSTQLNPPKPAQPLSGTLQEIFAKAPIAKKGPGVDMVGNWMVAAAVPDKSHVPDKGPLNPVHQNFAQGKANYEKLSHDQKVNVRYYTSGGYHHINDDLRAGGYGKSAKNASEGVITAMIPLKPGSTITRNHDLGSADLKKLKASVGTVLQDRAILSTSVNEPNGWSGNVRWHMTISPGVKGLPAKTFSASGQHEGEVILPPNTRIMVTHVAEPDKNGYTHAHAIILPYHEDQCCPP